MSAERNGGAVRESAPSLTDRSAFARIAATLPALWAEYDRLANVETALYAHCRNAGIDRRRSPRLSAKVQSLNDRMARAFRAWRDAADAAERVEPATIAELAQQIDMASQWWEATEPACDAYRVMAGWANHARRLAQGDAS